MGIDPVTAGIGAVGSIAGGLMGGQEQGGGSQTQTSVSEPWAYQQPYLARGYQEARNQFFRDRDTPWYQGPLYAGLTGTQRQGIDATRDFATGGGAELAGSLAGGAQSALGLIPQYNSLATGMMGQGGAQPALAYAGQFADSPVVQAQTDAALRDVSRNLNEDVLPGLGMQATGTGNTNSSRAEVAEQLAIRGAADRAADTAAGIRASAFNQGLNQYGQDRDFELDALSGVYRGAQLGTQLAPQALSAGYGNADALIAAGGLLQADQQGRINEDFTRWQGDDQRIWDSLNNYWGIVGQPIGGSTTTTGTQQQSGPGVLGGAMSGATGALGLYGMGQDKGWWGGNGGGSLAGLASAPTGFGLSNWLI